MVFNAKLISKWTVPRLERVIASARASFPNHPLQWSGPPITAKFLHIPNAARDWYVAHAYFGCSSHTRKTQKKPPLQAESQGRSSSVLMPFLPLAYEFTAFVRLQ